MSGPEYAKWVEKAEDMHRELMKEAGFLAKYDEPGAACARAVCTRRFTASRRIQTHSNE